MSKTKLLWQAARLLRNVMRQCDPAYEEYKQWLFMVVHKCGPVPITTQEITTELAAQFNVSEDKIVQWTEEILNKHKEKMLKQYQELTKLEL